MTRRAADDSKSLDAFLAAKPEIDAMLERLSLSVEETGAIKDDWAANHGVRLKIPTFGDLLWAFSTLPDEDGNMPTPRGTILAALDARLSALPATTLRGDVLPERVPTEGLLILRDVEPREPEATLSPRRDPYQHRAEIEAVVAGRRR